MNSTRRPRSLRAAAVGLLLAAWPVFAADEVTEALDASIAAQRAAKESQARVTRLDDEARALRDKRHAAQWRALQLSAYAAQLETEAANEEKKRTELEAQLARISTTGTDLMPLMQRMVAELKAFVDADLPFLVEPRRQRVADLEALLGDAQRSNADKFRRVMEAYRSELEYAHSLGAEDATQCGRAQGPAALVRVGRVGLYCVTTDGKAGAWWDAGRKQWTELDGDGVEQARKALAVARAEAPPELLVLPVRAAEKAP